MTAIACFTRDTDRPLFIDAALARFDRMSREEHREFVSSRLAAL